MQCFRVAGIGDDLGAILQWEYIAMSYKSVLAKSANAELLVPLALAGMFAVAATAFAAVMLPLPAAADPFSFSTGNPDGRIATAARPENAGQFEIETGDDFVLTAQTSITGATFTGLITGVTPNIGQ